MGNSCSSAPAPGTPLPLDTAVRESPTAPTPCTPAMVAPPTAAILPDSICGTDGMVDKPASPHPKEGKEGGGQLWYPHPPPKDAPLNLSLNQPQVASGAIGVEPQVAKPNDGRGSTRRDYATPPQPALGSLRMKNSERDVPVAATSSSFRTTVQRHTSWENCHDSPPQVPLPGRPPHGPSASSPIGRSSSAAATVRPVIRTATQLTSVLCATTSGMTTPTFSMPLRQTSASTPSLDAPPVPGMTPQDSFDIPRPSPVYHHAVPSSPIARRNWLDGPEALDGTAALQRSVDDSTSPLGGYYKMGKRPSRPHGSGGPSRRQEVMEVNASAMETQR